MPNLNKWQEKAMCGDKVCHTSRETAMITLKKMKSQRRLLHPYKCPICSTREQSYWHLGRKAKEDDDVL